MNYTYPLLIYIENTKGGEIMITAYSISALEPQIKAAEAAIDEA